MSSATLRVPRLLEHATRAVLVVDVVESVRLIEGDEDGTVARWLALVARVEEEVLPPWGGHLVKRLGDGLLLEFSSVQAAVGAAFAIRDASARANSGVAGDRQILLRMGLEVGDVIIDQHDLYGRGVNRAARLTTLAGPGEIVVSAEVREQLTAALDAEIEDLGDCFLKHLRQPVRAYRIGPPGPRPVIAPGIALAELLPSLAIIPFSRVDDAGVHHLLGEVLAEEMIREVSRTPDLTVISRLSTTAFRGRRASLDEIGAHLAVNYVLSGECAVAGQQVTVDAELAEARSGQVVWSRRFRGGLGGVLRGRREMINEIIAAICSAVMSREAQRARSQALPTLESYTLLIGAIALMHRLSLRDFEDSRRLLEALVERAPRQAVPQAWLARWHVLRVQQGWSHDTHEDARLARHHTRLALDTDPDCALALAVDGFVHTNLLKRLDTAEERYERAILSNPSDPLAWSLKGTLHAFRGEGRPAVDCTQRALRLSPLDPHRFFYDSLAATACLAAHQFERALRHAQRSYRANRTHTSTLRALAVAQWQLGLADEARRTAGELLKLEPALTVGSWLERSPSAAYAIGQEWADVFRRLGVPE